MDIEVIDTPIEQLLRYSGGTATDLHAKTISRLIARRNLSERSMKSRYDAWNTVDEHCRMFIDLKRNAKNADRSTDPTKKEMPWARSIVVPMSYAILQVYMTQLMGLFSRRDPPLEIQGVGPEDVRPAKVMNAVIGWDQTQTNYMLELYSAMQDACKYGVGVLNDCWEEEYGWMKQQPDPIERFMAYLTGKKPEPVRVWDRLTDYNRVRSVDPYSFYPDPRISLSYLQEGDFSGHRIWRGYLQILAQSQDNGGNYFNVEAVQKTAPRGMTLRSRNRFNSSQMTLMGSMDDKDRGFHAIDSAMISIVPRDWGLGDSNRPEKWHFAWADDRVIIRAHPSPYDHGRFNYSVLESNPDVHIFNNPGSIENIDGLQRFMNWFYNSHIQNVIRHLNNRMIYASSLIESDDVENPNAAMHIRLTAKGEEALASGRFSSISQMYQQLQITDVTGGMLKDVSFMMDLAMRMSGAADQMMGRATTERRTLGEIQRVGHEGSARMATLAGLFDIQALKPLALRWCSNRQQFTDEEQFVRITGTLAKQFGGELVGDRLRVTPKDLQGNYDYEPKMGPTPMNPEQMAQVLMDGLVGIMKSEVLMGMPDKEGKILDPHEILKEILRDKGIKNPDDFYRSMGGQPGQQMPGASVQVMPDEQVQAEQQRGNIVPMAA